MPKSAYSDQFTRGIPDLRKIQDKSIGRLARNEQKDREYMLQDWAGLAKAEASVKERYRGRYLFELLQNANDALIDAGVTDASSELDARVRFELTDRSLLVANCGQPFAAANVEALCRLHETTKSPSKQIGHKGIGFKSVLEIASTPEVYSDIYAFAYDGVKFRRDVQSIMGAGPQVESPLPVLQCPYPCYLNQLNPEERGRIERLLDDRFVTVIRLPWEDEYTAGEVAARIRADIETTLLLFMTAIQRIEIAFPDGSEICLRRELLVTQHRDLKRAILYRGEGDRDKEDSSWLVLQPDARSIQDKGLLTELGEAWKEVRALRFALAFPVDRLSGRPLLATHSLPFYVYFPTQEYSGLRFIVHADFYVGDDRKTLPGVRFNEWLINEICGYLTGEGMDLLKGEWRQGTDLVELLAPLNRPEREFPRGFTECYLAWLHESAFVRIDGGQYKEPCNVRFPPKAANQVRFRTLLPASRLRGSEKWAYAAADLIAAERERQTPFLLSPELGASEITAQQVVDSLLTSGMPPIEQCGEVIALLAEWWESLSAYTERPAFEALLKKLPLFPTGQRWMRVDEGIIFQANLRANVPDVVAPEGFDYAVINRSAYPDSGSLSAQYRFFDKLGARAYAARDLIRGAILPVLISPDRLAALFAAHPESLTAAYRMLFQYYSDERGSREMADQLARVLLPAWHASSGDRLIWRPANECYLGEGWPGGAALELIYTGFDDCYFVRGLPGLVLADEQEQRDWGGFLAWLGVNVRPRLVPGPLHIGLGSLDPFGNAPLWKDYVGAHRKDFTCRTVVKHGDSRTLHKVYALHHFDEIAAQGDVDRLGALYSLLATHWNGFYGQHSTAIAQCNRQGCYTDRVENYFLFALQRIAWLPATLASRPTFLAPHDIWNLGETEPADVRSLLPVLSPDLAQPDSTEFRAALRFISSSSAQIEDYVRLLGFLVEHYPRSAWQAELEERRRNPLTTTFNWALERIQTGLVGRSRPPICPPGLKLLAATDHGLDYVAREDPRLVYGDDPFMEARWRPHCAFLRVNEDWQRLRDWLGIPHLSTVVRAAWAVGAEREEDSRRIRASMNEVLPFLAALVARRQPAVYERILPRLNRLDVHIVYLLTVTETIDRFAPPVSISTAASVYLRQQEETRFRAGSLFCTPEVLENPSLLGDHIAGYIEIAGLSDAFVLLMHLDPPGRERYVESKGVTPEMLQRARADLGEPEPPPMTVSGIVAGVVTQAIREAAPSQTTEASTSGGSNGTSPQTDHEHGATNIGGGTIIRVAKDYPSLDTAAATPAVPAIERPSSSTNAAAAYGSGGGGTTLTLTSEEAREQLGKRGEEWVYASEKRRLADLGFDVAKPENHELLQWVSAGQPGSPYDIRSVDDDLDTVYIEVKSSSDRNPVIHLSTTELAFALEKGERYWLYWVGNAGAAQPDVPEYYRNLGRYIAEKKITLDVDSLKITLRPPT